MQKMLQYIKDMSDDIKDSEWIRPGQVTMRPKKEAKIDEEVSKIVGKRVEVNDIKLLALVNKHRMLKTNLDTDDNFMKNPVFLKELKQLFQ